MAQISNNMEYIEGNSFQYDEFILNVLINEPDSPLLITEKATIENSIVSKINTYLNRAETRIEGLNVISNVISKCSKDILTKYGLLWITKTTQVLESTHTNNDELALACEVLGNLLKLCKKIPEVQKEISLHHVKQLVLVITQIDPNEKGASILYPLVILLYYYKEPTEKFQTSINDFILRCLDSEDEYLIQASANCFSVLKKAIEKSFKIPSSHVSYNCWTYNEKLICNSLHCIINNLFSNVLVDCDDEDIDDSLKLPDLPEDNIFEFYFALERRFKNLSIYLSTMLRGCGGKNSVVSDDILKLLCRGLAITPIVLRQDDLLKNQILVIVIPKLHIQLFHILNGLVEGFSCHLIPVAKEILNLYVQSLKWIDDYSEKHETINGSKPFVNLKICVYKSLLLWLNTLGRKSGIEIISHHIFPIIFKDITPEKCQVSLTVTSNNSSKKTSKKSHNTYFANNSTSDSEKTISNTELCQNALCVLKDIFYNTGLLVSPSFYEKSHKMIVSLLYDVYLKHGEINSYKTNTKCRLTLIQALKGIIMNPHPHVPPPSTYAVQLFNFAMKDEEICIREEARIGLAELEKIIHPSAPTLDLSSRNHIPLSFDNDNSLNTEINLESSENMTVTDNNDE